MSRITDTFTSLRADRRTGLVAYICAGDPDQQISQEILNALPAAGADFIELGMPFTDPMADGPIIQAAAVRALESDMSVKRTLEMVRVFRGHNKRTPLILMGYTNPVLAYGAARFVKDAVDAGVDGLILVDLPPEEDDEILAACQNTGLDLIRLITPVTNEGRVSLITAHASGFLYYVSITGVTGTAQADVQNVRQHLTAIRAQTELPLAVGFGIKTADDVALYKGVADAVVVGSALVEECAGDAATAKERILEKVQTLKEALVS